MNKMKIVLADEEIRGRGRLKLVALLGLFTDIAVADHFFREHGAIESEIMEIRFRDCRCNDLEADIDAFVLAEIERLSGISGLMVRLRDEGGSCALGGCRR